MEEKEFYKGVDLTTEDCKVWTDSNADPLEDMQAFSDMLSKNGQLHIKRHIERVKAVVQEHMLVKAIDGFSKAVRELGKSMSKVYIFFEDGSQYTYHPDSVATAEPYFPTFTFDDFAPVSIIDIPMPFNYEAQRNHYNETYRWECNQLLRDMSNDTRFEPLNRLNKQKPKVFNRKCFMQLKTFKNIRKSAA